jgi:hypothetical protein
VVGVAAITALITIRYSLAALAVSFLFWLALPPVVYADSDDNGSEHESASAPETEQDQHRNMVSVYVGVTSEDRREKGLALGIEYERRLNESFGIGALAEHTFGDLDFWVYAVPFAYHTGRWKFLIAPGVEDGDLGSDFLVRVGGDYGFEVGRWEIAPGLDVDFVDGDQVFVLGVLFGRGF